MKISVIIPTCHRNDLLARCLECLSPGTQTLPAEYYEVIVTDDGRRTTAEQMIRERFPWAKWIRGPQRGPAANRNYGAAHASSEWLAFTDDDCVPTSEWLKAFARELDSGVPILEGKTTCHAGIRSARDHAPVNLNGGYLWSCNLAAKRSVFEALQGFDERFPHPHLEDVDFRTRLRQANLRSKFVVEATVDHPPRRVPFGWKIAAHQRSSVYYWYKTGNRRSSVCHVLRAVASTRIRFALEYGFERYLPWVIASGIIEIAALIILAPKWDWEYRRQMLEKCSTLGKRNDGVT